MTRRTRQRHLLHWMREPHGARRPLGRWRKSLVIGSIAASTGVWGFFVFRNLRQHDLLTQWRVELETQFGPLAWPTCRADWPRLSDTRDEHAPFVDLRGPYAYAGVHPEVLRHIPCYCGCARVGHHSLLDCYRMSSSDGAPKWSDPSTVCATCVNITREAALMLAGGMTPRQIRRAIDEHYGNSARVATQTPMP